MDGYYCANPPRKEEEYTTRELFKGNKSDHNREFLGYKDLFLLVTMASLQARAATSWFCKLSFPFYLNSGSTQEFKIGKSIAYRTGTYLFSLGLFTISHSQSHSPQVTAHICRVGGFMQRTAGFMAAQAQVFSFPLPIRTKVSSVSVQQLVQVF